jgi:hypothetical protein
MTLQRLSMLIYLVGAVTQLIQLAIQAYAYRRTPHYSIALLAMGTAAGLVYLAAAFGPSLLSGHSSWLQPLMWVMAPCFAIQMILGVWGTAALMRSYRRLAKGAGDLFRNEGVRGP